MSWGVKTVNNENLPLNNKGNKENNNKSKKEPKGKFSFYFSRKQLCIPYTLFQICFVIFPLLLIVYYAFTGKDGSFSFGNFAWFFSNADCWRSLGVSLLIGIATTFLCLLIGYPVAYILSRIKSHRKTILMLLFIMPMWINFVLRAMAMKELLSLIGLIGKSDFLNYVNVVIGMVYDYLPFMILPLYTTLIKMDRSLEEAALDLGASPRRVFAKVTFPLSFTGIISGVTMVLLPSMTSYVISDTFGNGKVTIIGKFIEACFGSLSNWNYGSAIALILLLVMFIATLLTGGFSSDKNQRGTEL